MKSILAIFLSLMLPLSAAITERYVSSTGTDTYANSTSSSTPMSLATAFANYAADDRINIKADGTYSIASSGVTLATNGPSYWRGYTTTIGDGGRATIDGGSAGASYVMLTLSGTNHAWQDVIFQNNGATGTSAGILCSGHENSFIRCKFTGFRAQGAYSSNRMVAFIECEATGCNTSNTSGSPAGIGANLSGSVVVRSHSHDHTSGVNAHGFQADGSVLFYRCIADSNTGNGLYSTADTTLHVMYCDFYNNLSGIYSANNTDMLMTLGSSNFANNSRYGVEFSTASSWIGCFFTNGMGSGTAANTLGDVETAMEGMDRSSTITYAINVLPWTDAAGGDFRISMAAAMNAGRGQFMPIPSYTGTTSYFDIGAAQHQP